MILANNKLNGCGLSNTMGHECLPKKTEVTQYYVATEGLVTSWCNCLVMHLSSDTFKGRLGFQLHSNDFDLKFILLLKLRH